MICPVTGKPCTLPKNVVINEIVDGNAKVIRLCHQCASVYLNSEKLSVPPQLPVLHPHNPQHSQYQGPKSDQPATPGQLLSELLAYFQSQGKPVVVHHEQVQQLANVCPACGISFAEIQKTGRMGCSHCYVHFKDQMDIAIQQIHGTTQHVGKKPKLELEKLTVDEEQPVAGLVRGPRSKIDEAIDTFEQKLASAIREERFEDCTKLRDVVKALKHIRQKKAAVLVELQTAAENEDHEMVQKLSAAIADLSKEFAALVM